MSEAKDKFIVWDGIKKDALLILDEPIVADAKMITFDEVLKTKGAINDNAFVYFTFPFNLWAKEVYNDRNPPAELYGSHLFRRNIANLVNGILIPELEEKFPNAEYLNHPSSIFRERDKLGAKRAWAEAGLPVAEEVPHNIGEIIAVIESGEDIYVKADFGSMGKGISRLSKNKWTTNYAIVGGKLANNPGDRWPEIVIPDYMKKDFLEQILQEDVVVEKAIINPYTNGIKFDMRAGVLYGQKHHAAGRISYNSSVTNCSQGNSGYVIDEFQNELLRLFPNMDRELLSNRVEEAYDIVAKAAYVLGMNWAGGDVLFHGETMKPTLIEVNGFPNEDEDQEKMQKNMEEDLRLYRVNNRNGRNEGNERNEMPNYIPRFEIPNPAA